MRAVQSSAAIIESSEFHSIVGYQNKTTRDGGQSMIAPTFLQVSSTTGCTLADLSVSGYEKQEWNDDDEDYAGGVTGGSFVLMFLSATGTAEARYYWIEQEAEKGIVAGWYADANGGAIEGGASSVAIPAGQALWIKGQGLDLTSAGAVNELDVAWVTRDGGQSAVGNNTPVDLTLNQLFVSGYEPQAWSDDDEDYAGGVTGGNFILNFLGAEGRTEKAYYWIEQGAEKGISAGWYADENGTPIEGGASSVSVPAGQGLWVKGQGLTLNIPAPEL